MRNGSVVSYLQAHPGQANYLQMVITLILAPQHVFLTHSLLQINEIAVGMNYLHGHGVLHGDLKVSIAL